MYKISFRSLRKLCQGIFVHRLTKEWNEKEEIKSLSLSSVNECPSNFVHAFNTKSIGRIGHMTNAI